MNDITDANLADAYRQIERLREENKRLQEVSGSLKAALIDSINAALDMAKALPEGVISAEKRAVLATAEEIMVQSGERPCSNSALPNPSAESKAQLP